MRKTLFLLGGLDDQDIDWMLAIGSRQQLTADTVVIHEGQPVEALYIILQGTLAVIVPGSQSREIARLTVGDMTGEMSFVDAHPPSATVKAVEETILLVIPRADLLLKIAQDPVFAARFYRSIAILLSQRLRDMDRRLEYYHEGEGLGGADADELDPNILDALHLAGLRFARMIKRLIEP